MAKISQRSPSQHQDPASLNDQQATMLDTLCQTTSKTGTQPHPLAERLPKIIIRPQTPQNTPSNVDVPTRKTRSSLIHQNTGTSPLHQEAYTPTEPNLATGDRYQKQRELRTCSLRKGDLIKLNSMRRQRNMQQMKERVKTHQAKQMKRK